MQHRYRVKELLALLTKELQSGSIPRAAREAQLFVMAFLEVDELWLLSHQEQFIERDITPLLQQIQRRKAQEPFEYIVQKVSFYSHQFYIDKGALIPRPETELLIDEVCKNVTDEETRSCFVEVGVGSGIISIILALRYKNARFIGVDISEEALRVASINIAKFNLQDRIELRLGSLLDCVDEKIDYLVSNPPYIANDAPLEENLSYEPQNALFGGDVGDEIIQKLLDEALKRKIRFFSCEMGYDQKDKIQNYLQNKDFTSLTFYKDYSDFDRGFTLKV
jgi:release factor glutamine methyltransferase